MEHSSRFFENKDCEYYPCHKGLEDFNCLFCYCPLYSRKHCPGKPEYIEVKGKTIKACTNCTFPHKPENYDVIMDFLRKGNDGEREAEEKNLRKKAQESRR